MPLTLSPALAVTRLPAHRLYHPCDPAVMDIATTDQLPDLRHIIGQERAVDALHFGADIRRYDFNVFVLGPRGLGRHAATRQIAETLAAQRPVPDDWCYVHDFRRPTQPQAVRLPPGRGAVFQHDMEILVREMQAAIPAALDSEQFRSRRDAIEEAMRRRQEQAFIELQRDAQSVGLGLVRTPEGGLALVPVQQGKPLTPEAFQALPPQEVQRLHQELERLQLRLADILERLPEWQTEARRQIDALMQEFTIRAVRHLIEQVRARYGDLPDVIVFLDAVATEIAENARAFAVAATLSEARLEGEQNAQTMIAAAAGLIEPPDLYRRFRVNLFVDNRDLTAAPVLFADDISVIGLIGQAGHTTRFGIVSTDVLLLRPGALHEANGGFLILDARRLLMAPQAYELLKRSLLAREIRITPPTGPLGLLPTQTLDPEPIPLQIKVILIGERELYYQLLELDPEFPDLFKVEADFSEDLPRGSPGADQSYARLIATRARALNLLPLGAAGLCRVIEQAARTAGDGHRLSLEQRALDDLLLEADYIARRTGQALIGGPEVQQAIDADIRRADRLRTKRFESIQRGIRHIATAGTEIGQVNGLAVLKVGDFLFGLPSRISARARPGRGRLIDIEREVETGGPLHSKGVLILYGFLASNFATEQPLSLQASLVFEQSYGLVDGDSASSTELYALLSALSNLPIRQSLAVTGSVDQFGRVQTIGGVNEKIEGFFDICLARGLTGEQGVLIPSENVQHLMLRANVRQAVTDGQFHVFAIDTIQQGIELLTGVAAGQREANGLYTPGSVFRRVEETLQRYARQMQDYTRPQDAGPNPPPAAVP